MTLLRGVVEAPPYLADPDPTEDQGCTTCGHDGTEHSSSAGCTRRLHHGTYVAWCACEGFTTQVLA